MGDLTGLSQTLGEKLYRGTLHVANDVLTLDSKTTPLLHLIAENGGLEYIKHYTWKEPLIVGRDDNEELSRYTDISDPTNGTRTAIMGELAKHGRLIRYDDDEIPADSLPSKSVVEEKTMRGLEDTLMSLEKTLFSNGSGSSNTVAGIRTWLPMADTGAVFTIPATRSNLDAEVLHHWANTTSSGSRTSAYLGSGFVLTDFINPDSGILETLVALKDEAVSRGFSQFYAFVSGRFMKHLKRYLKAEGLLQAANVAATSIFLPKETPMEGFSAVKVGGTYVQFDDITFILTSNLYTTTYDVVCMPFKMGSQPGLKIKYTKPNTEEPVKLKQNFVAIHRFREAVKGTYLAAPVTVRPQFILRAVGGCIALKYDGTYSSTIR